MTGNPRPAARCAAAVRLGPRNVGNPRTPVAARRACGDSSAARLLDLHRRPRLLLLPNAWDRASVRLLARLEGVEAIGTTSAGIAASPGLPTLARMEELGVRRLSLGSGLYRLALAAVREAMTGLLRDGDPGALAPASGLSYSELAEMLGGPS